MICGLSNWLVNISLCELYISRAYSNPLMGKDRDKLIAMMANFAGIMGYSQGETLHRGIFEFSIST